MAALSAGGYTGNDEELYLGTALLNNFIYERICRHGGCDAEEAKRQLGEVELCDPNYHQLSQRLQQLAEELDENAELRYLLDLMMGSDWSSMEQAFNKLAREIFSDGFNWGRVAALFYMACKLVIKAISIKSETEVIRGIIRWTMSFINEHVINWIREQGGWVGIFTYIGTPWLSIGLFLVGVLTAFLVIRNM